MLTWVLSGVENPLQCFPQPAAPNAQVVDGVLEEERDECRCHDLARDAVESKVLLDAVGRNEAPRDGGECSGACGLEGGRAGGCVCEEGENCVLVRRRERKRSHDETRQHTLGERGR